MVQLVEQDAVDPPEELAAALRVVQDRAAALAMQLVTRRGPFEPVTRPKRGGPACPDATAPPASSRSPFGDPDEDWLAYWGEEDLAACSDCETYRLFVYPTTAPWRAVRIEGAAAVVHRASAVGPGLAWGRCWASTLPR